MNSSLTDIDPFSEVADSYDSSFSNFPDVGFLRERVHAFIRRYFPSSGIVLDLACGTGEDTIMLARSGIHVIGADRSSGMLARAAAKSREVENAPSFVEIDAASLAMFRDCAFDAILSNFGGLNCVPDLGTTLKECHRVLRPGGVMVLCLLGAYPLWERTAFAMRGNWKEAVRRRTGVPVPVRVGQRRVDTWYYSIRDFSSGVEGLFDIAAIAGLSVVAPPPASRSFLRQYPRLSALLLSLDRLVQTVPILRTLGDHTVFALRRRTAP
jgi:ubiquinone/menaquinone biosynthesis C-methylase UbiE